MRSRVLLSAASIVLDGCLTTPLTYAIDMHPSFEQVTSAIERGQAAAAARTPPDHLYTWFGPDRNQTKPHGFLMTKLDALAVMSAHFGLRGLRPSDLERDETLSDPHLLISIILFGEHRNFSVDSYVLLLQGDRKIIPTKVRSDGTATRSSACPSSPAYRAKAVAFFAYTDFDPQAKTQPSVFPLSAGDLP